MKYSTEEQKNKYIDRANGVLSNYDGMLSKVNKDLQVYGSEFFDFTQGKTTQQYLTELKQKTKEAVTAVTVETFTKMVEALKSTKEDYINECFPITETTDQLELSFISKELEVMSAKEMEEFYKDSFFDKNKVRLFDIELKRRKNQNINSLSTDLAMLNMLREEYGVEDRVTKYIDTLIKYFNSYRQISKDMLCLVEALTGLGEVQPKMISFNQMIEFVEGKSRFNRPKEINILEIKG